MDFLGVMVIFDHFRRFAMRATNAFGPTDVSDHLVAFGVTYQALDEIVMVRQVHAFNELARHNTPVP